MRGGRRRTERAGRERRGGRGFSVLEILVAMTLTLLIMAITTDLILQSQHRLAHSGRADLDGSVELALSQIRLDVHSSTGFDSPLLGGGVYADGSTEPLYLNGHTSGDLIVVSLVDGELLRLVYPAKGWDAKARRTLLQGVSRFAWRRHPDAPGLLEVSLTYRPTADLTALESAGTRERRVGKTAQRTVMLTTRAVDSGGIYTW